MFGPRDSAYAVNLTYDRHTDIPTYIYISPEISIEHPSVGLASLAQSPKISIDYPSVGLASLAQLCRSVSTSVVSKMRRQDYVAHAHTHSHFWVVKTELCMTPALLISTMR